MSAFNNVRLPRILAVFVSVAFIGLMLSASGYAQSAAPQAPKAKNVHIYLLRGLFNIFSTGMDGIREKLQQHNIKATIHTHLVWSILADEAVDDYLHGRVDTIIIMGHSAGATNAVDMANKIGEAGVPVSLVVALDPSLKATVTNSNVRWVVNLYLPEGMYGLKINKTADSTSLVENIALHDQVSHVTLDKSSVIQDRAINYALKAIKGARPPSSAKNSAAPARATTGSIGQAARPSAARNPAASARVRTGNSEAAAPPQ